MSDKEKEKGKNLLLFQNKDQRAAEEMKKRRKEKQQEAEKEPQREPSLLVKVFGVFKSNLRWKLLSLVIAVLVWVTIMNIDDPYITVTIPDVPVVSQNESVLQEQGKISDIESGRTVTLKVHAPSSVAEKLTAKDFNAVADYRQMSLVYAVPIQVSVRRESPYNKDDIDITIESKQPEVMVLTLEDYTSETFRVDIQTVGKAAEGYYVSDMVVSPNLVQISGSEKQIGRIERVVVEVGTGQVKKSFEQKAVLHAYDKNGYEIEDATIEFDTKEVNVEVSVLPVKKILLLITTEGEPAYGYECTGIQHVPTEIMIAGEAEDLEGIYSMTIPFDIDMQNKDYGAKLNIETYLNEYYGGKYVLVDEEKYVTVTAYIEKLPTKDFKVGSEDISVVGLPEEYDLLYTTKSGINIKVLGRQEELDKLTVQGLKLYIDVTDYGPGNYYVSVCSDTDAFVTVRTGTIGIRIVEAADTFVVDDNTDGKDGTGGGGTGGDGAGQGISGDGGGQPEDGTAAKETVPAA